MSPQQPLERRWERFQAPSRVRDLWLVLNDDFRPAASHIRRGPSEADRLPARIGPQAQSKHIGEAEGSLYVEPVVGFKSDADCECCRGEALQSLSSARERPVHLAELCLKPDVDPSLVANLDHVPQRLVESGLHSTNYRILGLVRDVGSIEIAEVLILDPVVERATG